jgi:insulysin
VDSEHGKNLNSDAWRKLQLWKHSANPESVFSRFATGTFDTLVAGPRNAGSDPHENVKAFHAQHYSAELMRLAVVGPQPLDELQALVTEKFAGVPSKPGVQRPHFPPDAVSPAQWGTLLRVVPERDGHSVEIQWQTLSEDEHYRAAPCRYLSHLLGHEGSGSAFALLKAKGWATGLVAGEAATSYSACSFFMVRVDLTDEGQARVKDVLAVVFQYLALLQSPDGVNQRIWAEARAIDEARFHFRDKSAPYSYACSLSHSMQVHKDEDLLLGMYGVPLLYDPDLIGSVLKDLTPEKARVMWASKALEVGLYCGAVYVYSYVCSIKKSSIKKM